MSERKLAVDEHVEMANDSTNSMRRSAMSDVFYSPFHISSTLLIGYLQK